jgi:hypothetical protein
MGAEMPEDHEKRGGRQGVTFGIAVKALAVIIAVGIPIQAYSRVQDWLAGNLDNWPWWRWALEGSFFVTMPLCVIWVLVSKRATSSSTPHEAESGKSKDT